MALVYIETRTKNLPDSGAWQVHKFGTAAGEQRIALEGNWEIDPTVFDFFIKDVEFYFFTKSDMLDYINSIQEEIYYPTQHYRCKDYPSFYANKIEEINKYPEDFIVLRFEKNPRAGGTAYIASVTNADSDRYNFLRSICLSSSKQGKNNAYTTFHFVKYQDTTSGKYFINLVPIFSKQYSMEELSTILAREASLNDDVHVVVSLFGLKYAESIIANNYDCEYIIKKAELEEDLAAELETIIEVYKELKNGKITINPIANKKGMIGEYLSSHKIHSNYSISHPLQQIFYGAPGTGKSHKAKKITGELDDAGNEYERNNIFRTTFHPDTDYATFVGCYKPTMQPTSKEEKTLTGKDEEIVYKFVPQAFTDAYIYAYNHPEETTYLVIEEINRGNCAQIFGDLFQLLDRKADGTSEYTIKADKDLAKYLTKELGADSEGIKDGKLCLPKNLNILATMNTSDQSLFPMDSAFKRRWDWEYIPISYTEPKSSAFMINVGDGYSWVEFIKQVNKRIFTLTQSEDKELGNFFIKDSIDAEQFKSKVMFYLWYEVLRDEVENSKYFFHYTTQDENGKEVDHKFTFTDLYGDNAETILEGFIKYILKGAE